MTEWCVGENGFSGALKLPMLPRLPAGETVLVEFWGLLIVSQFTARKETTEQSSRRIGATKSAQSLIA